MNSVDFPDPFFKTGDGKWNDTVTAYSSYTYVNFGDAGGRTGPRISMWMRSPCAVSDPTSATAAASAGGAAGPGKRDLLECVLRGQQWAEQPGDIVRYGGSHGFPSMTVGG
jgi:hypothetical protein